MVNLASRGIFLVAGSQRFARGGKLLPARDVVKRRNFGPTNQQSCRLVAAA
jgi:hypothetical protein